MESCHVATLKEKGVEIALSLSGTKNFLLALAWTQLESSIINQLWNPLDTSLGRLSKLHIEFVFVLS